MKGIIYKYTSPKGKCYIGQTLQEEKRRYRFLNIKQSYGSKKIDNARRKYGTDNFTYEILFEYESDSKEELQKILGDKEIFYIKEFDSVNNGYNYQEGGLHVTNILSKETREIIAKKLSKKIIQYSLNGEFIKEWESSKQIESELGINHSTIRQNCSGKTKHCRNFIFKFKESNSYPLKIEVGEIKLNKSRRLIISQFDLNGVKTNTWKSVTEAARDISIDRHKLRKMADSGEVYLNYTYKIENNERIQF